MAAAGVAFLAAGTALVVQPALLSWVVAGTLGALGLLLLVSAVLAAGGGPPTAGAPPSSSSRT
jgi:hypothetical protein